MVPRACAFSTQVLTIWIAFSNCGLIAIGPLLQSGYEVPLTPNATLQAPPMAAARHERRLLVVACKRLFGKALASFEPAPVCPVRLSDHLICQKKQGWGHRHPERLGRLEVDDQLEPHRLLHRQ